MAVTSVTLASLLNRMTRWQAISRVEEKSLVRDLDEAIRTIRRTIQLPWTLQKGSLRVFDNVLEYPVPDDQDELAYIDNPQDPNQNYTSYEDRARFRFTTMQQFYENPDYRNDLAEIWDGNVRYLGARYTPTGTPFQAIDMAEDITKWTASGDSSSVTLDIVNFKEGYGSIKFGIVQNTGVTTLTNSFLAFSNTNYQRYYYFVFVYLASVPTSIELRFGSNSSNYFSKVITTQFSGQPLKANQWNTIAFDLNTATQTGVVNTNSFAYAAVIFNGAASGVYNIDTSYFRQWTLMDYWYYSKYNVMTASATVANQEYFMDATDAYSLDSSLVGDSEWADVIMYDALMTACADVENKTLYPVFQQKKSDAWGQLLLNYPSMKPLPTSMRYRFLTELNEEQNYPLP